MVLSHGTGLPNWGGERLELQFDPGEGFNYSGEGFVFLQRAVEHVTGLSLDQLARREVFEPLGMTRSSYVWQERFAGNAVYGKDWAWRMVHVTRYEQPNAASSLLTTARDYARFVAAVLNGRGLAAETVRAMITPERAARRASRVTPADDHVSWGLGWGLQEGRAGRALWQWGDNGRFKAYVVAYPASGAGVVYLTNANDGLSIAEAIVSRVVDDDHWALRWLTYDRYDDPERLAVKAVQRAAVEQGGDAAVARYREARGDPTRRISLARALSLASFLDARDQPVSVRASLLERYVGEYGPRRVRLESGVLYYRREDNPEYRLIPMADDVFALDGPETFRIRFVTDGPGPTVAIEGLYLDGSEDRTERSHP